eukprot:g3090.t1
MGMTKPGFVFEMGAAGQPSTSPFAVDAPSITASSGSASPKAGGTTPGGGVAARGFSFLSDAPAATPAALSKPRENKFSFSLPSASTSTSASGGLTTAPSATSPLGGFKFNSGGLGAVGAAPAAFNGFKVPAGVAIPPPVAAGSGAADEEDAMPKEDPSKLERAPGEENEEVVGHFRAKLFRFKMSERAWGDMGVGMLRLMKHTTNDNRRMVLRNDMGKVLLNAAVYEGMGVTKAKNTIKFVANVEGDGPTTFMVKVTADDIDDLHTRVVGLVPSS